jgi:hypothetical protein
VCWKKKTGGRPLLEAPFLMILSSSYYLCLSGRVSTLIRTPPPIDELIGSESHQQMKTRCKVHHCALDAANVPIELAFWFSY